MRRAVRKTAHVLERCGLALAGAACGLFVAAYVGSTISGLTTQGFLLVMMLSGAIGFYLGIDEPPTPFREDYAGEIDAAEFLSAAGTFCATLTAFASVAIIILRESPHAAWAFAVLVLWVAGVAMQIVAGAAARRRK